MQTLTYGIRYLSKIIHEQNKDAFLLANSELFPSEDETRLYQFIVHYIRQYGAAPPFQASIDAGFRLPTPTELDQPLDYYFNILVDRFFKNEVHSLAGKLQTANNTGNIDRARELIRESQRLLHLGEAAAVDSLQDAGAQALDGILDRFYSGRSMGVTTGYQILDEVYHGYSPGNLFVIVGRPNTGKSYFMLQQALAAWQENRRVVMLSAEMPVEQLTTRLMALHTRIDPGLFQTGELDFYGIEAARNFINEAQDRGNFYFMRSGMAKTLGLVRSTIQRTQPDILFADAGYLLSTGDTKYYKQRREKIADVMEGLKEICDDTGVPIVTSVQFNRAAAQEHAKKKSFNYDLSMLAETDVIGQIASGVTSISIPKNEPSTSDRRLVTVLKAREGRHRQFLINYKFSPHMDLSFLNEEFEDDENTHTQQVEQQLDRLTNSNVNNAWRG